MHVSTCVIDLYLENWDFCSIESKLVKAISFGKWRTLFQLKSHMVIRGTAEPEESRGTVILNVGEGTQCLQSLTLSFQGWSTSSSEGPTEVFNSLQVC